MMSNKVAIEEIFSSLQGEGRNTGMLTTFIRLFGCNLSCKFCDTGYSESGRLTITKIVSHMSAHEIIKSVESIGNVHVCITGGEPLMPRHAPHVYEICTTLADKGFSVEIETNGSMPIFIPPSPSVRYIMDIKTPSSGCSDRNDFNNLSRLGLPDDLMFIISNKEDFYYAYEVLNTFKYDIRSNVYFSACFDSSGKSNAEELARLMLQPSSYDDVIHSVQLQVQQHKIIGVR